MAESKLTGTGPSSSTRTYKEMVEIVKKLHKNTDELHERLCKLFCSFADVSLKAALLFDPVTVQIMSDKCYEAGAEGLKGPDEVHFTRESVNDAYIELSQMLSPRPTPPVEPLL